MSEIDDPQFFLAKDGKYNAKHELEATIYALYHEKTLDDNATGCKFPARKRWLIETLDLKHLPHVECVQYRAMLHKLNPTAATVVFPSAHINSPASLFGHTFLRIDAGYNSKLLSYAINYAANVDAKKTNGIAFAINGLIGGYKGEYSMLPYYEKLKEYRDTEQRDIWEYDLNLSKQKIIKLLEHIWELNGMQSDYFFFTENCSYNLLWLLEIADKDIALRRYFTYHVSPLETIHAMEDEGLIRHKRFRDSKRSILLKYERLMDPQSLQLVDDLIHEKIAVADILQNKNITIQQKRYIFEVAVEFLEYLYVKRSIDKSKYLSLFHALTNARAPLGLGKTLSTASPSNPIDAHRQARVTVGVIQKEYSKQLLLGIRPVYHNLEDPSYGFLRGTQIEFLNAQVAIGRKSVELESFHVLSLASITQINTFFKPFSWRLDIGWDKSYIDDKIHFHSSVGLGASIGNRYGYTYLMADALMYVLDKPQGGLGTTWGLIIDKYKSFQTNIALTKRWYTNGKTQEVVDLVQSYTWTQNTQIKLDYTYKRSHTSTLHEHQYKLLFNYYF